MMLTGVVAGVANSLRPALNETLGRNMAREYLTQATADPCKSTEASKRTIPLQDVTRPSLARSVSDSGVTRGLDGGRGGDVGAEREGS